MIRRIIGTERWVDVKLMFRKIGIGMTQNSSVAPMAVFRLVVFCLMIMNRSGIVVIRDRSDKAGSRVVGIRVFIRVGSSRFRFGDMGIIIMVLLVACLS